MIQISDKSQCTGCTACQQVCAHRAINMEYDSEGHSYPMVDTQICIDCGLCEKVCPIQHKERIPQDVNLDNLKVYAAYNKDNGVRERSTSGGIFTSLSQYILNRGGIVYAARFNDKYHIIHSSFNKIEDIDPYRGSKYAQSELNDTFKSIKSELTSRVVLFVGTPCQVAGLKSFLRKEYDNLYTCDFICMGISSSKMWDEYLVDYWKGKNIERIFFKDKRGGWHQWKMLIKHQEGEYLSSGMEDPFFYSYLTHLSYRPSCLECPFRTCRRLSDFTIADCWGIDKVNPSFDDNKGCTTLILQSRKAELAFSQIKEDLESKLYNIDYVKKYNPYIVKQIQSHPDREKFYTLYKKSGFKTAASIYCRLRNKQSIIKRIINKLRNFA